MSWDFLTCLYICLGWFYLSQNQFYLLKVQGAELGLLPKLPFTLCVCIVQLARQLLGVPILLDGSGFI